MRALFYLALTSALVLTSCSSETRGEAVSVELVTGLVAGADFFYADVDLFAVRDGSPVLETADHKELRVSHDTDYARGSRVATFMEVPSGQSVVRVRLLRADRTLLVARRMRVTVNGNTVVRVQLTRDCVGVECPLAAGASASSALSECLGGACVPDTCDPTVPSSCPTSFASCVFDACTMPSSSCAEVRCVDGVCIESERENACADDEWCNPDPEIGGCERLPVSTLDGGVMPPFDSGIDGGVDAGVDASVGVDAGPVCGAACTIEDQPCQLGFYACDGSSSPMCVPLTARVPGTACGDGKVCDPGGRCVECEDGTLCYTNLGCYEHRINCGLGGTCSPTDVPLAEGSICYQSTMSAFGLCNDHALCIPCVQNERCETENECSIGRRQCNGAGVLGACVHQAYEVTGLRCGGEGVGRACAQGGCTSTLVAREVVSGANNSYAILEDGSVAAWGQDRIASISVRGTVVVPVLGSVDYVATNATKSCGATSEGTIGCWTGGIYDGAPGGPTSFGGGFDYVTSGLSVIDELDASAHTFCVRSEGSIWCWGDPLGHCGDAACTELPQRVAGISDAVSLHMGDVNCVVRASGALACWDGDGSSVTSFGSTPSSVSGVSNVVDVSTGSRSICVIERVSSSARVLCWGDPSHDVLGFVPSTPGIVSVPTELELPFHDATQIRSVSNGHCVVRAIGDLWCWGDFRSASVTAPTHVPLGQPVASLSEGGNCHVCGRFLEGEVFCSATCGGANSHGQLGVSPYTVLSRLDWMVRP